MNFNFKKWNTITGWIVFLIALTTYTITLEPTVSFWDCGEYITTAAKLQVGHPPGAPLFQMIGAFMAMFAAAPENVAYMVNMMSAASSAFTILFMFWSMTMILQKFITVDENEANKSNAIMVIGSAFIGSLAYTFSDSFWFNAVEAEVYAMASLLISVLMWAALHWEKEMDSPNGNRWLLLISFIIGLSFGVHIMALLTIPAIGMLYFFKKYQTVTIKNFIIANVLIVALLYFIFKFLFPFILGLFGKSEIFMVNSLGLPFNSGTIFTALVIVGGFIYLLKKTNKPEKRKYNTIALSFLFLFIGFTTWLMLPIRANANVVINENKPSDAAELLAYYNREQYGEQNTFWGPYYTDAFAPTNSQNPFKDSKPNYERDIESGKYVIVNNYVNAESNPNEDHVGFLPRLWSREHAENYMSFTSVPDFTIKPDYAEEEELIEIVTGVREGYRMGKIGDDGMIEFFKTYGPYLDIEKPSFIENIQYMFEYQFGYMYGRYLLWNFVGKQNDEQGRYDNENGNWLSGIDFIDEIRLGSQKNLPSDIANNPGRNTYYFLPFILGLIGLIFHYNKDKKSFYVLLILFLFTSLALKVFLNERPFEPRERDYAVVPSFYVFAMWLGFGVFAIYEEIKKRISPKIAVPVVLATSFFAAPVLMASQNWDDHNRSGKNTAWVMAKAYLDSCEPNAILFTIGDNDTFPLWYLQEIENYRTDVRIVNTQLLNTDWYIDQMKAKAYESEGVPITFTHNQYVGNHRDYVIVKEITKDTLNIKQYLDFIKSDDPRGTETLRNGQVVNTAPARNVRIPVNKENALKYGIINESQKDSVVSDIVITIKDQAIMKNRLMMLDILANSDWKRPIHFTGGSFGDDDFIWLKEYLQLNGMVYQLVPIKTPLQRNASPLDMGTIDSEKMYKTVTNWDLGSNGNPDVYHDPETKRQVINYRSNLARLTEKLLEEGKKDKAKKVIDLAMEKFPINTFGFYTLVDPFINGYYQVGEKDKARKTLDEVINKHIEVLNYYEKTDTKFQNQNYYTIAQNLEFFRTFLITMQDNNDTEYYEKYKTVFNSWNKIFERFGRNME
nr:DUF2723 domain-containing protein [uncultured Flavobacterium sp.]